MFEYDVDMMNILLCLFFRPMFVEYTGLSAGDYACGPCAAGTKDVTCMECAGATNASCNAAQEVGKSFMCYDFTYDAGTKVFAHKVNATTCQRLAATDVVCNSLVYYDSI